MNYSTVIILAHLLISLIYLLYCLKNMGRQQSFFRFTIVLLLPVIGLLFFLISGLADRLKGDQGDFTDNYEKYIKGDNQPDYFEKVDFKKEINIVPIEDSLTLSPLQDRRSFLIDLLKRDYSRYIKALQKAVENEDSETSHYAGAALMEIKKQFEHMIKEADEKYKADRNNHKNVTGYIEILKKYLNSGLSDKMDRREFSISLSNLLEKSLYGGYKVKQHYIDKISIDLELGNYQSAEEFGKRFAYDFPNDEEPYLMLAKLFYFTNNYTSLRKVFSFLTKSEKKLSANTRSILEFWERFELNDN